MGPSIGVESNDLNPLHCGNKYPLQFLLILMKKKLLKTLAIALDQDLTCLIFPLDGHVFLPNIVEMPSGYTYFRWIAMVSSPFTLFLGLKVHFRW